MVWTQNHSGHRNSGHNLKCNFCSFVDFYETTNILQNLKNENLQLKTTKNRPFELIPLSSNFRKLKKIRKKTSENF